MEHSAVIGRLAPSPTGRMHIGNAYAALAAWLGVHSRGGKLILRIDKNDGAIQYYDADRNLLVSENPTEPRIINNGECWTFFDWEKSEKLKSKGVLATDLMNLTNKARYISFGGRQQRLPLVVSNKGYGIAPATGRTALFCNIKMYGQYLYADGDTQSDYYFLYGGGVGHTLELYKIL